MSLFDALGRVALLLLVIIKFMTHTHTKENDKFYHLRIAALLCVVPKLSTLQLLL